LEVKCQGLQAQIDEAKAANKLLLFDLEEKTRQAEALKAHLSGESDQAEKCKNLREELEGVMVDLEKSKKCEAELRRDVVRLEGDLADIRKQNVTLGDRAAAAEASLESLRKQAVIGITPEELDLLRSELLKAEEQLEEMQTNLHDLKWEKKKLDETIASLVKENHQLYMEKEEQTHFLEEAHATIASHRRELDEKAATGKLSADETSRGASLLGELEKELQSRTAHYATAAAGGAPAHGTADDKKDDRATNGGTSTAPRKKFDPNPQDVQEYFFLAATAARIHMCVTNPHVPSHIFAMDSRAWYQNALQLDIPFHEWHNWINSELERSLIEYCNSAKVGGNVNTNVSVRGEAGASAPNVHTRRGQPPATLASTHTTGVMRVTTPSSSPSSSHRSRPASEASVVLGGPAAPPRNRPQFVPHK